VPAVEGSGVLVAKRNDEDRSGRAGPDRRIDRRSETAMSVFSYVDALGATLDIPSSESSKGDVRPDGVSLRRELGQRGLGGGPVAHLVPAANGHRQPVLRWATKFGW
jgi:hypothetical protein